MAGWLANMIHTMFSWKREAAARARAVLKTTQGACLQLGMDGWLDGWMGWDMDGSIIA